MLLRTVWGQTPERARKTSTIGDTTYTYRCRVCFLMTILSFGPMQKFLTVIALASRPVPGTPDEEGTAVAERGRCPLRFPLLG